MVNYPENGIAIKPFYGESMDRELLRLADFLKTISYVWDNLALTCFIKIILKLPDVRPVAERMEEYGIQSKKEFEFECDLMKREDELVGSKYEDL